MEKVRMKHVYALAMHEDEFQILVQLEDRRRLLELLDVRGTIIIENDKKVVYVKCLISLQSLSLIPTSPLSDNHNRTPITITSRLAIDPATQ